MVKRKSIRTRGKIKLSKYFQEFKDGEKVAVTREQSVTASFPKRLQGKTGVVEGKRGRAFIVKISDGDKTKKFLIKPIHLKQIK